MADSNRQLARELAGLLRRVAALERAPRLRNASIEGTSVNVYGPDGQIKQTIGQQTDGTYTTVDHNGPTPPTPTAPTGVPALEGVRINWDGLFTNASVAPLDFSKVEVHASTDPAYDAQDSSTLVSSIVNPSGGWVFISLLPGAYFIKLVTRSTSNQLSPASAALELSPGTMGFQNDEATATVDGAPVVVNLSYLPRSLSEHVYWNGLYQGGSSWTRDGLVLTFTDPHIKVGDVVTVEYARDAFFTPPPIITSPASGSASSDPTPTITGTAIADRTIEVFIDNVSIGTTTVAGDGTWAITSTPLSVAPHDVRAVQIEPDATTVSSLTVPFFTIAPSPLASLTLRGVTINGTLPAATQLDDFIVVASQWGGGTVTCTDSRLAAVGLGGSASSNVWVGRASDLSDPTFDSTAFRRATAIATFHEDAAASGSSSISQSNVTSVVVPVLAGSAAIAGVMDSHSVSPGQGSLPSPWVAAVTTGVELVHASIYYWRDPAATSTPAGSAPFNGGSGRRTVTVVPLVAGS